MSNRTILRWLHVLTSVGWMSMALALAMLIIWGVTHQDRAAFAMAEVLDVHLLQHLATAAAVPIVGYLLWRAPLLSLLIVLAYPVVRARRIRRRVA